MALMEMLRAAQGGQFIANAAAAAGLEEAVARRALAALCPAFARALKDKAQDAEAFAALLDILEDGGQDAVLDDAAVLAGVEVIEDGGAILDDLYGARAAALAVAKPRAGGIGGPPLERISAIAAVAVLAALSRSSGMQSLASAAPAQGGGFLATIFAALLKGLLQCANRSLAPKRRRRYASVTRRRAPARRRGTQPSLDDLFRDILRQSRI